MAMSETETLAVWTDGEDTVIATSAEDAVAVYEDYCGKRDDGADPFVRVPDHRVITIRSDDPDEPNEDERTAAQWVRKNGRGFLCSASY